MSKTKLLSGQVMCRFLFVMMMVLCLISSSDAQDTGKEKAEMKKEATPSFGVAEPKEAEEFFKEAKRLEPSDPLAAIRLYREGMILKPDAWQERKQIAVLYEKQQQWGLALAEYEAVNKVTGSVESFADLSRIFDKAGYPRAAAVTAREGFAKHTSQQHFLLISGEIFLKIGAETEALAVLQEYVKLKPEDGKAFFLLGSLHEKAGRFTDALYAYIRARELLNNDINVSDAVKRIQARTVTVDGLTLIPPQGWLPDKNGLTNIKNGERIKVGAIASGDPAAIALKVAREAMPEGLFADEAMKSYEQMKKKREEMIKADPESGKQIESVPVPLFNTRDVSSLTGAKMALLSTGETPYPGMESAVAMAIPSGGKIYTMVWKGAAPVEDGLKVINDLFEQTVWSK